ncbi:hypothetical protein [Piscinibacter koreensis]|uniref:Uncharacterized protein n=1 Tax=Piscinibacter koreensis TaxID=2742824 RepID=A0A7Y6NMG7_9BURK|nr:hypothetical protein [Schlegelella koreensis]NUZ05859.1 hypothetical protein [Schlegelella koreensis]
MTDEGLPVPTLSLSQRIALVGVFGAALAMPLWVLERFALALQFAPTTPLTVLATGVGLVQATLLCRALARRMRARKLPLLATYAWYVKSFPGHVNNGQVSCRFCGSHKKAVRSLPEDVRMRGHSCGSCGALLYVASPGSD